MRRTVTVGLLVCLLSVPSLAADASWPRLSFEVFGGSLAANDGVNVAVVPLRVITSETDSGTIWGVGFGYAFNRVLSFETELAAGTNDYTVRLFDGTLVLPGEPAPEVSVIEGGNPLIFLDTGLVVHLARGPVVPYLRGSVSGIWYIQELRSLAYGYGAGVRFRLAGWLALRLELRGYRTRLDGEIEQVVDVQPGGTFVGVRFPFEDELRFRRVSAGLQFLF